MIPIMKLTNAMIQTLPLFAELLPICSPRGCIDISAPAVKRLIPIIRKKTPKMKSMVSPAFRGTSVKLRARTISAIGATDFADSVILSLKRFKF